MVIALTKSQRARFSGHLARMQAELGQKKQPKLAPAPKLAAPDPSTLTSAQKPPTPEPPVALIIDSPNWFYGAARHGHRALTDNVFIAGLRRVIDEVPNAQIHARFVCNHGFPDERASQYEKRGFEIYRAGSHQPDCDAVVIAQINLAAESGFRIIFLGSGDGDFTATVRSLKNRMQKAIDIRIISGAHCTSKKLVRAAGSFIPLDAGYRREDLTGRMSG